MSKSKKNKASKDTAEPQDATAPDAEDAETAKQTDEQASEVTEQKDADGAEAVAAPEPVEGADAASEGDGPDPVLLDEPVTSESAEPGPEVAADAELAGAPETVSDASAEPSATKPAPASARQPVFIPMVIGGVIAAGLGYFIAEYNAGRFGDQGPSETETELRSAVVSLSDGAAEVDQLQAIQTGRIETLEADLANLAEQLVETTQQTTEELTERVTALEARLDSLVTDGIEGSNLSAEVAAALADQRDQISALTGELQQMSEDAQAQMAQAAEEIENVAAQEARASARAALAQVRAALETGAPYADVLPDLVAVGPVPPALSEQAEVGIPSQMTLRSEFGSAARDALSASRRSEAGTGAADRVRVFLQDQIGARALVPQEGDSPNAVLSRVEGAVKSGALEDIGPLIAELPQAGQDALAGWFAKVASRQNAMTAIETVNDMLSGN
ncbi:MAG: hypothetical protein AAGA12_07660 [Pseudomonadota bacterium]